MSTFESLESRHGLPPLALIAGPTASGKSDLAVRLALALKEHGCEAVVVNADSAQVYADLAVLSARPSSEEMCGIEHRLFSTWDGAVACSAVDWAAAARDVIAEVQARNAVPILVGGTGLYLRTLLDGIAPVPPISPEIRTAVRALPTKDAYAALQVEDPARAAMLASTDSTRVARSLEVVRSTGESLAVWQAELTGGIGDQVTLHPAVLLPPRDWLYARCDVRFAQMLESGALNEVKALLCRQLDPDLPAMRAIGVAEIAALLAGSITCQEAEARGAQATRNYAKRQFTWLRNQSPPEWPRIEAQSFDPEAIFVSLLRNNALT
jgi:tRNA dimethylallyltransferase